MKNAIALILFTFSWHATAQNRLIAYPNISVKTPKASVMDTYNNIPISYYSGVPNIQIPIYEIAVDDVKIPITLNYHSSGIRVNQEATWVGLGWSLDAGGMITRQVNGADDFMERSWDWSHPTIRTGFYDGPSYTTNTDSLYELAGRPSHGALIGTQWNQISDSEPDIFSYSIPGFSGKFLFDNNKQPVLFSRNHNIRVEVIRDRPIGNVQLKLTDGQGNQYYFIDEEISENYMSSGALNQNSTEATAKYDDSTSDFITWEYIDALANDGDDGWEASNITPYAMTSTWCLSRIVTSLGRNVFFTYEDEDEYLPTQESCVVYNSDRYGREQQFCRSKVVNQGKRLTKITWDEGSISFTATDREDIKGTAKKLDRILVKNSNGETIKDYTFTYSYFNDDYSGNAKYTHVFKRLKLVGLTEASYAPAPGYSFEYYSGGLPAKNSNNKDYWGMQNGREYGSNYYAGIIVNGEVYPGVTKESDFSHAVIGALKQITYPTGGYAKFTYEPHYWGAGIGVAVNNDIGNPKDNRPVSGTNYQMAVCNNYVINEHPDLPATDTLRFRIITPSTSMGIDYHLENHQCNFKDSVYGYYLDHILELYKISETGRRSLCYYKECPYLFEAGGNGGVSEKGEGCENSGEIGRSLDAGEYELIAHCPPKDVSAEWNIHFSHLITKLNNEGTETTPPHVTVSDNGGAGLRIAKIETDMTTRTFRYPQGILMRTPVLYYFGRRPGYSAMITPALVQVSESKSALSTFGYGNYVGYDWVEEQIQSGNDTFRTRYHYMNEREDEQYDDKYPECPYAINYTNGLLTKKETYWNENLVKEEETTYSTTKNSRIYVYRDKSEHRSTDYTYTYYYDIEWPVMRSTTETTYEGNGEISRSMTYTYNSRDLLSAQEQIVNGDVVRTVMRYPFDFHDEVSDSLTSNNRVMSPVEITKSVNGKVVSGEKITYSFSGSLLVPSVVYQLNTATGLSPNNYSTAFEPLIRYHCHTRYGNPQEVWHNSDVTSYLWSCNGLHPFAKIEGLTYTAVENAIGKSAIAGLLAKMEPSAAELSSIRNVVTNLGGHITTYTLKPLVGITSETQPNGNTIHYSYDSFGRLKNVSDVNDKILQKYFYHYSTK